MEKRYYVVETMSDRELGRFYNFNTFMTAIAVKLQHGYQLDEVKSGIIDGVEINYIYISQEA